VQLTTNNAVARDLTIVIEELLPLAIFAFDGAFGGWRAALSIWAGVPIASAVRRLTDCHHGLLQLLHRRTHAVDVIGVQTRVQVGDKSVRRMVNIAEVVGLDPTTKDVLTNDVFKWNPKTDTYVFYGRSYVLENIMKRHGYKHEEVMEELNNRRLVLEWMVRNNIRDFKDVVEVIRTYYVNPLLFKVIPETAKEVKPGEVAVIVSNTGKDPSDEIRRQMAKKVRERMEREEKEQAAQSAAHLDKVDADEIKAELMAGDPADRRLDEGAHEAYVVPEGYRGIQETVVGPGRYYVNTLAITPIVIPTTNQTVEWTSGEVVNTFNPFEVISKDGFTMQLEVRVVFRVKPEDAPFMVAKIGGIDRLVQNVMHPLIDSIFRNQASESSAMAYLQNRHEEQERAEARVRAHLLKYHVDVVNVLICHIHLPEDLMITQTEKILAEQRQNMYNAQREAEEKRIQRERTKSQADNQKDLMGATVGVEIAGKRAEQRKAEGEGEAHYIQQTGRAEAEKMRLIGEAQGVAYREQVNALGAQGVARVEVLKVIGEKGVRITPDIMASGGASGGDGGGIGTLLLLNLFRNQMNLPATNGEKSGK